MNDDQKTAAQNAAESVATQVREAFNSLDRLQGILDAICDERPDGHFNYEQNEWRTRASQALRRVGWLSPTHAVELRKRLADTEEQFTKLWRERNQLQVALQRAPHCNGRCPDSGGTQGPCARCGKERPLPWKAHDGYICVGCLGGERDDLSQELARTRETRDGKQAEVDRLARMLTQARDTVRDFAEHGIRFDLTPTVAMLTLDGLTSFYQGYLQRIDRSVRERAQAALEGRLPDWRAEVAPEPCLDPDKMHGAADGFGGTDFPEVTSRLDPWSQVMGEQALTKRATWEKLLDAASKVFPWVGHNPTDPDATQQMVKAREAMRMAIVQARALLDGKGGSR